MTTERTNRIELPSQDEGLAIVARARQLRAETLARLLRAGWARIAHRTADGRATGMPAARA